MNLQRYLSISREVSGALRSRRAVVAFDSSSTVCDMPRGRGFSCALAQQRAAREAGAVPATIAVVDGVIRVGLEERELAALCKDPAPKLSRRDLPVALALGGTGAVTSAVAMIASMLSGIRVFSTARIGGARSGGPDVSADLQELQSSSLAVVCGGVNPGADPAATLEYLETMGVPVLGLATASFPALPGTPGSFAVDRQVSTELDAARVAKIKWDLGLGGGVLIACQSPPQARPDEAVFCAALEQARMAAQRSGIRGHSLAPYLTAHIIQNCPQAEQARVALAQFCAQKAAGVASALCRLK